MEGRGLTAPASSMSYPEFPRTPYTGSSVSENTPSETVQKGYEQRADRRFCRYTEAKTGQKYRFDGL